MPCNAPKITKSHDGPCHKPAIRNTIKVANIDLKKLKFLKDLIKGVKMYDVKKLVRVMCHLCQKSIIPVALYGLLKFNGKIMLNKRAIPVAISM